MVGSRTPIEWWERNRKREVFELSREHINQVLTTTEKMKNVFGLFSKTDDREQIKKASDEVIENERTADEAKSDILDDLAEGTFHPINRDEIIRLVMTADDIGDNAKAASAKITLLDPKDLDKGFRNDLDKLSVMDLEIVQTLERAYSDLLEDPEKAIEDTRRVEKLEEKIDIFRAENLLPKIIEWGNETHKIGNFTVLKEVEENLEEVADQTENVADVIRSIAISFL